MEHRVKHLRLFGCRLNSDSIAVNWLLRHAGRHDAVEYIEVNVINSAQIPASFSSRNHFATVPFLEITFDHTSTFPHGTTKVSDLAPWTEASPCTTQTADGKTIAEPNDGVLCLVEAGAMCAFFAEHFDIAGVWNPRSAFQRCRVNEVCAHTELLARRLFSMVLVMLFAKTAGTSDEDAVTGIAAHERELLWSFRIMEDMLTRSEEAAAHAAGLDYQELLAIGEREVEEQEAEAEKERSMTTPAEGGGGATGTSPNDDLARTAEKVDETSAQDTTPEKGPRHSVIRPPTSPTLVALDAFIVGRSMSIADFVVASDLLVFPYLQSWLPSSLKHTRFPAIIRYLERMRTVEGAVDALRPRLSFMKVFRRRPKIMASNPTMNAHAERLRKLVDRIAADRVKQDHAKNGDPDGASAEKKCEKQSENEQLSEHRTKPTEQRSENERQSKPSEKQTSSPTESSTSPKSPATVAPEAAQELQNNADCFSTLSRKNEAMAHPEKAPANETTSAKPCEVPQAFEGGRATQWAPCLVTETPLLPPSTCTLVAEDEVALRRSERAVSVVKRAGRTRGDRSRNQSRRRRGR